MEEVPVARVDLDPVGARFHLPARRRAGIADRVCDSSSASARGGGISNVPTEVNISPAGFTLTARRADARGGY